MNEYKEYKEYKDCYVKVTDDTCYVEKHEYDTSGNWLGYKCIAQIPKEAFVECYKQWISNCNESEK